MSRARIAEWVASKVLPDPRVQQALERLIFVRDDIDRPSGADAARRCRARRRAGEQVLGAGWSTAP